MYSVAHRRQGTFWYTENILNTPAPQKPSWTNTTLPFVLLALLVAGVVWAIIASTPKDYAKETIKPIGDSLMRKGATFVCDGGHDGRGIDNRVPYNRTYYKVTASADQAVTLATQATAENGYHLTHATPDNRGPLGDISNVDKWYFDNTSKTSPYNDLEQGPIIMKIVIESPGTKDPCNPSQTLDAAHSLIGIEVVLPAFKINP
jgi:hypothetical protein